MSKNNIVFFNLSDEKKASFKGECIDPAHEYRILVPVNDEATELLYKGEIYINGEISNDMIGLIFYEDTFYYMESKLFDFINVECDTLINMYEEEILDADQLDKAINIIEVIISNTDDKTLLQFAQMLLELLNLAKRNRTIVGFCF